jgi:hypothetical protein
MVPTTTSRTPISAVVHFFLLTTVLLFPSSLLAAIELVAPSNDADCLTVNAQNANTIFVDTNDAPVVQLAANLFADDVQRVTGSRPRVTSSSTAAHVIIAGSLGHSDPVDQLAKEGKLKDLDKIRGKWDATLMQMVQQPFPGVESALVIVGSNRRGAAYGLMQLSEKIGVSPWYWWADVPVPHRDTVTLKVSTPQVDAPGVKYRGIFINDEDWGLNPWASKTFDPEFKNIGPKTYEKVFELLLRLRLNYIWPAMHACSAEFGSASENVALADKFGIVAGSSHCEPMLCNNVHWKETVQGKWNYSLNRDTIHSYWEENAKARGAEEAVWTLGIRGIHDKAMETPPTELTDRINLVDQVIKDQRALLDQYVTKQWGPVAQCFVPYKEVLPIYDAGLKVPEDVTLVWVDDNFGYIRRLSAPAERQRSGGAGVYWHISYYGNPHSYTWIDTTAPALMWEELHKAWENDTRNLWVINVGDIKPGEIGIDYFSRLAWNPDGFDLGAQRQFLHGFAARNFGDRSAQAMSDLLMDFYRLGTIHKPELMNRAWALSLPPERAAQLEADFGKLLRREKSVAAAIPKSERDAYTELIGFPARVLGSAGLIFMADRRIQEGKHPAANQKAIEQLRAELAAQVGNFNTNIAGGKWNRMMPGLVTGKALPAWNSQVRWPWGETVAKTNAVSTNNSLWRDAATADQETSQGTARWNMIEGLGPSGRAMALEPESLAASWHEDDTNAPALEYNFKTSGGDAVAFVDFLPTFRIYPGMKLRVAVSVDNQVATLIEVPGSSGAENENGTVRSAGVQDNYTRARIPLPSLAAGKHTFTIRAVDPGAVIDRVSLPVSR